MLRNFFLYGPLHNFYYMHQNGFKKLQCEQTFILCETSLVLKKDKCLSVENILVLKFDKAILKK